MLLVCVVRTHKYEVCKSTHHVGSSLAVVLASKLGIGVAIGTTRLQVRGDSTLDRLRHCVCCLLVASSSFEGVLLGLVDLAVDALSRVTKKKIGIIWGRLGQNIDLIAGKV